MLEVRETELTALRPWDRNPRANDQAVSAVSKSIRAFGFNVPVLCDENLTIIAGHTRWKAAKALGLTTIPVIVLHLTDAQRRAFSIADNKTAEIADWDMPELRAALETLRSEDFDLHDLGFSEADLRRILLGDGAGEDEVLDAPKAARTKPGQVFGLDAHRLVCGNSCESATWDLLLQGSLADMVISSPPRYNNLGMGTWNCFADFCSDMARAVNCVADRLAQPGVVFWTSGNSGLVASNLGCLYATLFEDAGLEYLDTIAWARPGVNYASSRVSHIRRNSLYLPAHQWEPILVYRKPGEMKRMSAQGREYMLNFQADVWEVPGVNGRGERWDHPTVAPVEIPYRALQAYSGQGDTVVDPFAGSGTTLIAVESAGLGRRALLAEISPAFCDVIIDRWESFTGRSARLLEETTEER